MVVLAAFTQFFCAFFKKYSAISAKKGWGCDFSEMAGKQKARLCLSGFLVMYAFVECAGCCMVLITG